MKARDYLEVNLSKFFIKISLYIHKEKYNAFYVKDHLEATTH